jgi:hypothetical protein
VRPNDHVLIDSESILFAHARGVWLPMATHYRMVTMATVFQECLPENQLREVPVPLDLAHLRTTLDLHDARESDVHGLVIRSAGTACDLCNGSKHLLAHSLSFPPTHWLCLADPATARVAALVGLNDRVVDLMACIPPHIGTRK